MWARLLAALVGCWILAAPRILTMAHGAAVSHYVTGPIAASFAIVAINEATRSLRWAAGLCGIWMLIAPVVVRHDSTAAVVSSIASGAVLVGTSLVQGKLKERLGMGWGGVLFGSRTRRPA